MKSIKYIAATTLVLVSFSAHADRDGGVFQAFFNAMAEAAAQQQGHYEERHHSDSYQDGYYPQGPAIYDISGSWGMRGGKVNRFQKTYDGYYVIPVGRGKGVHYIEVGENLYQDARSSGTYEVVDRNYMIWRSNDRRNRVIELYRQ